jgi:peroxiredoxin
VLAPGDELGEVELADDGGGTWRAADRRGRVLLLVFHRHLR